MSARPPILAKGTSSGQAITIRRGGGETGAVPASGGTGSGMAARLGVTLGSIAKAAAVGIPPKILS